MVNLWKPPTQINLQNKIQNFPNQPNFKIHDSIFFCFFRHSFPDENLREMKNKRREKQISFLHFNSHNFTYLSTFPNSGWKHGEMGLRTQWGVALHNKHKFSTPQRKQNSIPSPSYIPWTLSQQSNWRILIFPFHLIAKESSSSTSIIPTSHNWVF